MRFLLLILANDGEMAMLSLHDQPGFEMASEDSQRSKAAYIRVRRIVLHVYVGVDASTAASPPDRL